MAYENPVLVKSYNAGADLSGSQYAPVVFSSGSLALAASGANAIGGLQNDPTLNQTGTVMHLGITRAIASAAIAQGAKVSCAGSGKVKTAVSTNHVYGIALEAAAADGDIIAVLLCLGGAPLP